MSIAARVVWAVLLLSLAVPITWWSSASRAQEEIESELLAEAATEASLLATQIAGSAYSGTGNAKAAESFQKLADEVASLLQQIASENLLGKEMKATGPLFDRMAALALEAIRVAREGGITIDPIVADEFARQVTELEKRYHPSASESKVAAPIATTSLP